jgi:hypothetical protein
MLRACAVSLPLQMRRGESAREMALLNHVALQDFVKWNCQPSPVKGARELIAWLSGKEGEKTWANFTSRSSMRSAL